MKALVTNIQGYSIHDGPGIRTVVFLKGCSLACRWCSNPECVSPQPELGFLKNLCAKCGKCADVCLNGALTYGERGHPLIDRDRCNGCGACVGACDYRALVLYGKAMDAEEVFDAVRRDDMFYQASGGGVTVSGGECLLQTEFVCELFAKCRAAGIHTCIETSGQAPESSLRRVLPLTDYVLYDLKLMDSGRHRRYTGKPNDLILANARVAAESGVELLFRMPLVPGINDDAENIKSTAELLQSFGKIFQRIELMPYHRLGKGKYDSLGKRYPLPGPDSPDPHGKETVRKLFEEYGIRCTISQ